MSMAGYKRRYVEDDTPLGDLRDVDHLYYNATLVGDSTNRFSKTPAAAQFSERRQVPMLTDTTGWQVAVTHLTAQNVTSKLPILEPTFLSPSSYDTIYNVGVQVDFLTFPTGSTPSPQGLVTLPTASSSYVSYTTSGLPFTANSNVNLPLDVNNVYAPYTFTSVTSGTSGTANGTGFQVPRDYVPGSTATIQWVWYAGAIGPIGEWVFCLSRTLADGSIQPITQQIATQSSTSYIPYVDSQAVFVPGEFVSFSVFPVSGTELPNGSSTSTETLTGPFGIILTSFLYQNAKRYTFNASAPVVAVPQHPVHPTWCTSYNHWSRNVTRALQTAAAGIETQLQTVPSQSVLTYTTYCTGSGVAGTAISVVPGNPIPPIGSILANIISGTGSFDFGTYVTGVGGTFGTYNNIYLSGNVSFTGTCNVTFTYVGTQTSFSVTAGGVVTGGLTITPLSPSLTAPLNYGVYSQFLSGNALASTFPNSCYISSFSPTKLTLSNTGSAISATTGTLNFVSASGSIASVTLPAGSVTAGTPYVLASAPTNDILLGAIVVSGANVPNGTSIIGTGTNPYSLTFSASFTATATTYAFINLAQTTISGPPTLPKLAYPAPSVSYSPSTNLFSLNAHPNSIIGRALTPSQENDANAASTVPSQNYAYKYRLTNGSALDVSYAVLSGPIVFPTTSGTPMSYFETWTVSFNEPLQALMPFPLVKSLDCDASLSDGTSNEIGFHGASLVVYDDPFSLESATTGKQYVLSLPQEFVCTGSWNPFVGLTITTSSIPVQLEGAGLTTCYSGRNSTTQTGGAAHAVLFDYNFDVTDAHSIVQGIDYNPQGILRWTGLTGGPLADLSFDVYLKKRNGTLVPLDLPADATIDLKLLFSKQSGAV